MWLDEISGKRYKEDEIRAILFDGVLEGLDSYRDIYIHEKENIKDDLDVYYQLLQLAIWGKIEDVIEEITNYKEMYFVKEDE